MLSAKLISNTIRGASARLLSTSSTINQASTNTAKSRKVNVALTEAEIDLPIKPKKPITPWLAFFRERKDEVLRQGKLTVPELASILSKEWKQIDKTPYENDYNRRHEEYRKMVENYENSLTEQHRDYLNFKRTLNRESKALKELRKTKPPTLPRNPANLYCQDRCRQLDMREQLKYRKMSDVFSDLFKEYRSLSDADKQKYINMQEEDKSRFQREFLAWYESIQSNENLTKAAREQANLMRDKLKTMNYL